MRTLLWFLYFWLYLLIISPAMHKATKLTAQNRTKECEEIVTRYVGSWASGLLKMAGVTVTVKGLENIPKDESVIFIGNHQGNFDIPILLSHLDKPHGFISKIEVNKIPLIRTWMRHLDCIFIDRKNPRQSLTALYSCTDVLARGQSVVIFPEGTRGKGGPMGEFKQGAFKAAFKAKATVVPFCMDGSYRIMEANKNWIKPAHVTLTILPPIPTRNLTREETAALAENIRSQIIAVQKESGTTK